MPEEPIQSPSQVMPGEKGNKFTKYLIAVLVIVVIAVVAEGVYYYTNILNKPENQEFSAVLEPDLTKPLEIDDEPASSEPVDVGSSQKQIDTNKLELTLNYMNLLERKQYFLEEANFSTAIKGQVIGAGFEESSKNGLDFVYKIKIQQEDGKTITYKLTDIEVIETKVFSSEGGALQLKDVSPGNILTIKVTFDLLDSSPQFKLELIVEKK